MVLLEALFDNKTHVKERVEDVLTRAVESGELAVPPGERSTPLKTVTTSLPQVVKVDPNIGMCFLYVTAIVESFGKVAIN